MNPLLNVKVYSEVGRLRGVIIHSPGAEVSSMAPTETEGALFSDIINMSVAHREYAMISDILSRFAATYEVRDLLARVLEDASSKQQVLDRIEAIEPSINEKKHGRRLKDLLLDTDARTLAGLLVEGVEFDRDNVERFFSKDRYLLVPMYNFFFTRDSSMSVGRKVLAGRMANAVRERESVIMKSIFDFTPEFQTEVMDVAPYDSGGDRKVTVEGGDVLMLREDVIVVGCGLRTTPRAIDAFIDQLAKRAGGREVHVFVQELPRSLESFIHLDMVFTMVDKDKCVIYEPVIRNNRQYRTLHVRICDGRQAGVKQEPGLLEALRTVGLELKPIFCGGDTVVNQQREQWHSGANFFAVGPGKVLGYARNYYTAEAMSKAGFEIIKAADVIDGKVDVNGCGKFFITLDVSELARGGGGLRCMTMPVHRDDL